MQLNAAPYDEIRRMPLTLDQAQTFRQRIRDHTGAKAIIRLFDSRMVDVARLAHPQPST